MPFGGLWEGAFPAVFWHSGRYSGVFPPGAEKRGFAGFSGSGRHTGKGKGARTGLTCPQGPKPLIRKNDYFLRSRARKAMLLIPAATMTIDPSIAARVAGGADGTGC